MGVKVLMGVGLGMLALGGVVANAQYRDRQTEEPAYAVVSSENGFELRDYDPLIVAEVTHSGDRRRASGRSFQRLAAYIFGQDRPAGGEKIAMTAPVLQKRVDENQPIAMTSPVLQEQTEPDQWRMRFVMPAKFTMETLPTPPADITLTAVPARRVAAVRFNGNGSASDLAIMETMLLDWIEENDLTMLGEVEYAFYDAPMVPGRYRRNEVLVEVAAQ